LFSFSAGLTEKVARCCHDLQNLISGGRWLIASALLGGYACLL
jgi:hypothetical protein